MHPAALRAEARRITRGRLRQRLVDPPRGSHLAAKLDELIATLAAIELAGEDPWDGHDDQRLEFHLDVAVALNVDVDLINGAPAVILRRQGDRSVSTRTGDWTGLGDYSRNVQDILDQLMAGPRRQHPASWSVSGVEGFAADVGDEGADSGIRPALALLAALLKWHKAAAKADA